MISDWLGTGYSQSQVVQELQTLGVNTSKRSIQRALKRWNKIEQQPFRQSLPTVEVTSSDSIYPARVPGYIHRPNRNKPDRTGRLIVAVGDQQAPFHDENLHRIFCDWLAQHKPDEAVLMGDTMDLPDVSKYMANPEWHASVQDCVNSAYLVLLDYVQASENTVWTKLSGNHDDRLRRKLLDQVEPLYGIRRADIPGKEMEQILYSPAYLLRLDELGVDYINPNGSYEFAQHKVSDYLAALHGWKARKKSGTSAHATLEQLGFSCLIGHTHRQALVHKTVHDIDNNPITLTAAEVGCMCRVQDGLGHSFAPDWQQGWGTATVWPDNTFNVDLATYIDGTLYWRNERYT